MQSKIILRLYKMQSNYENCFIVVYSRILQSASKNVNNQFNTNIYSYLEASGGQSCNLYLNVVQFFNTSVN